MLVSPWRCWFFQFDWVQRARLVLCIHFPYNSECFLVNITVTEIWIYFIREWRNVILIFGVWDGIRLFRFFFLFWIGRYIEIITEFGKLYTSFIPLAVKRFWPINWAILCKAFPLFIGGEVHEMMKLKLRVVGILLIFIFYKIFISFAPWIGLWKGS